MQLNATRSRPITEACLCVGVRDEGRGEETIRRQWWRCKSEYGPATGGYAALDGTSPLAPQHGQDGLAAEMHSQRTMSMHGRPLRQQACTCTCMATTHLSRTRQNERPQCHGSSDHGRAPRFLAASSPARRICQVCHVSSGRTGREVGPGA